MGCCQLFNVMNTELEFTLLLLSIPSCLSQSVLPKKQTFIENSNFLLVSKTEAFVDKTLLLKNIFRGHPFKLITAPRKFGKSTNLHMIKTFLSITVDDKGRRQNKNLTEIHDAFRKLLIYEKDMSFFYNNFGMHPVIDINFKTNDPIKKCSDAVKIIKHKIHESYKQHLYLCKSTHLNIEEKGLCETWCDDENYKTLDDEDVSFGLVYLAKLMRKQFDTTKVFLLVDEYDTLVTAATFMSNNDDLECVLALVNKQLSMVMKSVHIRGAIMCGVSALASLPLVRSSFKDLARYRFLEDHSLVTFYGMTEEEVNKLFRKRVFNLDPNEIMKARVMYSGYVSKNGEMLWCTYSVLKFLEEGEAVAYWPPSIYVEHLMNAYQIPAIEETIDTLLKGKPVKLNSYSQIKTSDFLNLRKMYSFNPFYVKANTELFLLHVLELGYLTFLSVPDSDPKETFVKLPNQETKQCLMEYLWNIQVFSKL